MSIDAFQAMGMAVSPSLRAGNGAGAAYELKFLLDAHAGGKVEAWARQRLTPDPHGVEGAYRTTTLYCDTPALDVFHRSAGFRRRKYRLRRYGDSTLAHLERKSKRGDRVRKRRDALPLDRLDLLENGEPEPDSPWTWFLRQLRRSGLRPSVLVGYDRTAFLGETSEGPVRLTMDRHLIGVPAHGWHLPALHEGKALLTGEVLVELKFHNGMPALFRELLGVLPPQPARVSKYRRCVSGWGLAEEVG